ncbi:MAG: AAA family ATPase [Methanomassiliicoccus sp.]|nr:AAA family ATPase [Methanomassiliicoccus sp.]
MRITISGPPGSGKTTACRLVAERLHLRVVISGDIFRQLAKESSMSLATFGSMCESDPDVDRRLDERMVEIARSGDDLLLEGRLTAHMLTMHGIPAFRVYMGADLEVRAARVVEREGGTQAQRKQEIVEREKCEARRYRAYYDIDINDRNIYDLVIDTTDKTPEQVSELICDAAVAYHG